MFGLSQLHRMRSLVILLVSLYCVPASVFAVEQTPTLSFDAALELALREAPGLAVASARLDAARQTLRVADALPDPKLVLGVDNLPIEGADRFDFAAEAMTMRRVGIMQDFPNNAKRHAREVSAQHGYHLAEAEAVKTRNTVRRETAVAWIKRATAEKQLEVLDAVVAETRLLAQATRVDATVTQVTSRDALVPRAEILVLAERRDELDARREQAIAQLQRWIGEAAHWPIGGESPQWKISAEKLATRLESHPDLLAHSAHSGLANAEVLSAQAASRPDWALEFAYQYRAAPSDDMIMLQVSIDLPVFARWRQTPVLVGKQSEYAAAEAELADARRELVAQWDELFAEYRRLERAGVRQREAVLPLVTQQSELTLAAWRANKATLSNLIDARRERLEAEIKAIALDGERSQLAATLHFNFDDSAGEQL